MRGTDLFSKSVLWDFYMLFFKIDKFMMYLRQKRQLENLTSPLESKATRSVMHLCPLGRFFKGLRVMFW